MIEFLSTIQVELLSQPGEPLFVFQADPFEFDPDCTTTEGGTTWNCDITFIIDVPESRALRNFATPRLCRVMLHDSHRRTFTIGTHKIPALVQLSAHLNRARMRVECQMLHNPLTGE